MFRIALTLAAIALIVYAATDCAGSTDEERRGLPKPLWMLIIIALPVFGAIAWLVTRYSGPRRGPRPVRGPRPPVAPDDDPDFLWRLEQERRRRQGGAGSGTGASGSSGAGNGSGSGSADAAPTEDDPSDDATDGGKGSGTRP